MDPKQGEPLASELREAEATMDRALEEACTGAKPAGEVETGELIHVEELLATAADAAKRAVSLRRRRRVDTNRVQATLAYAEAALRLGASHRTVTDARGVRWDVFAVHPEAHQSLNVTLQGTYQQGWLCFNAGPDTRRLSPIPDGWQTLSEDALVRMVERAEPAPQRRRRTTPPATDESATTD